MIVFPKGLGCIKSDLRKGRPRETDSYLHPEHPECQMDMLIKVSEHAAVGGVLTGCQRMVEPSHQPVQQHSLPEEEIVGKKAL